jgi:oligosaccharyltransferase complex subunit delta (ribophorin II)
LVIASFGSSAPFSNNVFNLDVKVDPNVPKPKYEKPLRYGKLPEIHHIFKSDPKSGPIIISMFFVGSILTTVPILLGLVSFSPDLDA